jgi:hypothetical protein
MKHFARALVAILFFSLTIGCQQKPVGVDVKKANAEREVASVRPVVEQKPAPTTTSEANQQDADLKETETKQKTAADQEAGRDVEKLSDPSVQLLFDGKTLDGWEKIQFGGEGDIEVVEGEIRMQFGDPLTGICVPEDADIPKTNYEVSLKAMKRDGNDFFCGLTFPVNDSFCTLVVGGWAGTLVGLSNLDGVDASDNGTRVIRKFEKNRWYSIRVRVVPDRITAWIDDEKLIDESIKGREVSIRNDVITTTPLGITSFITEAALKDIAIKTLDVASSENE